MNSTQKNAADHVREVERRAVGGDTHAIKTLAVMCLLVNGFDGPDDDGGLEVPDNVVQLFYAA